MPILTETALKDGESRTAADRPRRLADHSDEMCIILVEWSIRPELEEDFLLYWSQREVIADRSGLIGEFLSRVDHREDHPWVTWEVATDCVTYVNVAMWRDMEAFERQIVPKMHDDGPLHPFQLRRQRRVSLGPQRWRLGGAPLPSARHRLVA